MSMKKRKAKRAAKLDKRTDFKPAEIEKLPEPTTMTPKRTNKNAGETKEQQLKRLATGRVNKILSSLGSLSKLSRLKPTESQTKAVFAALEGGVNAAFEQWKGAKPIADEFQMPDEPAESA